MSPILNLMACTYENRYEQTKVGRIIFEPFGGTDSDDMNKNIRALGTDPMTILGSFHTHEVQKVEVDDDYLFDIRANTHLLEFGYSEYDGERYVIHTGNHKGQRIIDIYLITLKGEK